MNDLLMDCKVVLGLAQSMAEREGYDPSVYDKCIDKINQALSISDVVGRREQLISFFNWYKDDPKELSNNETIVDAYLKEINYC